VTAITLKQAIDSLPTHQLDDLMNYITTLKRQRETAEFMAGVLHDQRVHPQQHSPHVSGSYESVERAHRIALAKAEERAAAAAERSAMAAARTQ
jgi:hypothetical protein